MAFSKQQLHKFADLIRIDISDEKLEQMNIDSVIDWLDKLQQIDTNGVEPMLNPAEHKLPRRADVVTQHSRCRFGKRPRHRRRIARILCCTKSNG